KSGTYASAPIEKRMALGHEQYKFATAVFAYDPVGVITAILRDTFKQLTMIGLTDYTDIFQERKVAGSSEFSTVRRQAFNNLPRVYTDVLTNTAVWKYQFPTAFFSALTGFAAIVAFFFIADILARCWKTVSTDKKIFGFAILLGLVSNAFVCGTFSGPHNRY